VEPRLYNRFYKKAKADPLVSNSQQPTRMRLKGRYSFGVPCWVNLGWLTDARPVALSLCPQQYRRRK